MEEQISRAILISAKSGDTLAREELIRSHKTFIAMVSSKICNRYLTWDNDDELSIALLAFNEAIDNFDPQRGASFYSFVQMVIRRRLIDFFRQEGKHQHLSLSPMNIDDEELSRFDLDSSLEQYQEIESQEVLAEVIESYVSMLSRYKVTLDDLIKASPKQRDSRQALQKAAVALSHNPDFMVYLKTHRLLPLKELAALTGVKRKALEKGRKYLIALALIFAEPAFFPLKTFMQIPLEPRE